MSTTRAGRERMRGEWGGATHRRSLLTLVTVDFLESDLRFKVDSSAMGPFRGRPVIIPAGQIGDRAWVFFASPDEISAVIKHQS
jgi:hypothetical protein